jgi:hypothetical protein
MFFFPEQPSDSEEPYVSRFYETREFITTIKKTRRWNLSLATLKHALSPLRLSLGSPLKSSGLFTSGCKIQKFYGLPTQYIYVF